MPLPPVPVPPVVPVPAVPFDPALPACPLAPAVPLAPPMLVLESSSLPHPIEIAQLIASTTATFARPLFIRLLLCKASAHTGHSGWSFRLTSRLNASALSLAGQITTLASSARNGATAHHAAILLG